MTFALITAALLLPAQFDAPLIQSAKNGSWSQPATWVGGKVPAHGDRVHIQAAHRVIYNVANGPPIRFIHVAGTLTFARDRNTTLDVGLLRVQPGALCSEDGFECDTVAPKFDPGTTRAALEVGTANEPIPVKYTAKIRLRFFPGMNPKSLPALVCCGGRMDLHGAPMKRTWVKLGFDAQKDDTIIALAEPVPGWKAGDRILITATRGDHGTSGTRRPGKGDVAVETEVRFVRRIDGKRIHLNQPLRFPHSGSGDFRAAVANLSRNVIVESAEPNGVRGHTMYHSGSAGSISYAEFRHLGKEDVLGRYAIHYHLVGNTMRGSYVVGASIWDSHNRWITIHGTHYLIVRDCVGYQSVGHGYYLEDGTEVYNVLDRNLAVQAFVGKKLPKQVFTFDPNDGAGFWWGNSLNTFVGNAACENDRYGFRFDAQDTSTFNTRLLVMQPNGRDKRTDIRTLPFVRFDGNEAFCDGKYGFNLGDGVERIGPDNRHPFVIRDMKIWEVHYAFRPQSPSVLVENMKIFRTEYGVYHPNYDHHFYRNLYIGETNGEPFNRGKDDDSVQYGPLAVDGLTFDSFDYNEIPLIQITDNNPTGKAQAHFRNVTLLRRKDNGRRALVNLGGGNRPDPESPYCVPVYLHDYFGKGRHAKVLSVKDREAIRLPKAFVPFPPLTGDASRVAQVRNVVFPRVLNPVDDLPPATVITHVKRLATGAVAVRGVTSDNGTVTKVVVNGHYAKALRANFLEWRVVIPDLREGALRIEARGYDEAGNVEMVPHRVTVAAER